MTALGVAFTARPGGAPLYVQVERALHEALRSGTLGADGVLPPERQLAAHLGVSRVTVRRALARLRERVPLTPRQGSGTFLAAPQDQQLTVLTSFSAEMRAQGRVPSSRWLDRRVRTPTADERVLLELGPGVRVTSLQRLRLADGQPVSVERTALNTRLAGPLVGVRDSLYAALAGRGLRPVRALQRMRAVALASPEAELLEVGPGTPGLQTQRLTYLADGQPLELTRSHIRADAFEFVVELRGTL